MFCTQCGRKVPDDAAWCPYCGAELAPPDDWQDEAAPVDEWQDDYAPANDWDNEAEPSDETWADASPVSGWEDDAPYMPEPHGKPPRSKALLITIFAVLGVAVIVLLIALNIKPKSNRPTAAVTPAVTATVRPSTAPTPKPTSTPKPTKEPVSDDYILPDSATRRLTQADVADLTWEQCCLARNEIFARHGRLFQTPQIAAYFEAKSWYHGTIPGTSFSNDVLSQIERDNIDFLVSYENATWGHSYY